MSFAFVTNESVFDELASDESTGLDSKVELEFDVSALARHPVPDSKVDVRFDVCAEVEVHGASQL